MTFASKPPKTKGKYDLINKSNWSVMCFVGRHEKSKLNPCKRTRGKAKLCDCPCHNEVKK